MELLEGLNPETEIRLATQPRWAFEWSIQRAEHLSYEDAEQQLRDEADENEEDYDDSAMKDFPEHGIVYIAEGSQIGYLDGKAAELLEWK